MTATLERRLGAVEKRMGVTNRSAGAAQRRRPDALLEWIYVHLAAQGDAEAASRTLAAGDAEEARAPRLLRASRYGRTARPSTLEPGVRWPYLRARARSWEERPHYRGPRSARTETELQQKLNAVFATLRARP